MARKLTAPEGAPHRVNKALAASEDVLKALKAMRAALRTMPDIDPFAHGELASADSLAEAAIAQAESEPRA